MSINISKLFFNLTKLIKRWPILLVIASYLLFTVYYMGPSVWRCNDTMYGFGDNTAGPVWRFGLEPKQAPLGSYENVTNYPVGENLYSPVNYSLSGQSYLIWGASRIAGSKCGYNIINILGFVVSAAVMFGFIYSITRNKWIAWLAGFAVSFSPYYQMKVGGHPGYGFQALLIAVAWAFFNLIKKQRKRDALYLGAATAVCFYFDPYFSILAVAVIGSLLMIWAVLALWKAKKHLIKKEAVVKQLCLLAASMGIFLVLLAPLAIVTIGHREEISKLVASARGDVLFEARACSNLPHEYLTPFVLHPVFENVAGKNRYRETITKLRNNFSCGIGEDSIGLSLAATTIVGGSLVIFGWEHLNKRRINLKKAINYDPFLLYAGIGAIGLAGFIMALPPAKYHGIATPSFILLAITTTWRTLARFYMLVNISLISFLALFLAFYSDHFKKHKRTLSLIFIFIFLAIFIEYQAFRPFSGNKLSTFSFSRDVPSAYVWLAGRGDINEIAEYPMERSGGESNAMAYYLSMQLTHKKTLFNGSIATTYEEHLRSSLKDLSDAQTLSVLASLGVDAVVIHGIEEQEIRKISGLEVIYSTPQSNFNILAYTPLVKKDIMVIAKVIYPIKTQDMIVLDSGFPRNALIIKSAIDWEYEALSGSKIKIAPIPGYKSATTTAGKRCFSIRMAADRDSADLILKVDGKVLPPTKLTSTYLPVEVIAKESIIITNSKSFNMRVKDLGCQL